MKVEPTRRLTSLRSSSLTFGAILFILSIAPSAQAQHDDECSTATLRGAYGYFFSGSAVCAGPAAAVGLVTFDGLGGVSAKDTLNTNGMVVARSGSGIYQVNSNCTGSASITVDAGQFSSRPYELEKKIAPSLRCRAPIGSPVLVSGWGPPSDSGVRMEGGVATARTLRALVACLAIEWLRRLTRSTATAPARPRLRTDHTLIQFTSPAEARNLTSEQTPERFRWAPSRKSPVAEFLDLSSVDRRTTSFDLSSDPTSS
jgi:hypothetical protein